MIAWMEVERLLLLGKEERVVNIVQKSGDEEEAFLSQFSISNKRVLVYLIASESAALCGRNLRRHHRLVFCPLFFCVFCVFCVARDLKSDDK